MTDNFILKCEWCGKEVEEIDGNTGECPECKKNKEAWC
jgi:DNA-directed RNA polymerase subunit RPC12/RpoP